MWPGGGLLLWSDNHWVSRLSPDGKFLWNGSGWDAVRDDDPIFDAPLDHSNMFSGPSPRSGKLASKPLFKNSGMALGDNWIAKRGFCRWLPKATSEIESVGIVGPSLGQQLFLQRVPTGNDPEVRFNFQDGTTVGIKVQYFPTQVRMMVISQLPQQCSPTPAGAAFLLGVLGKRYFGLPGMEIRSQRRSF